MKSSNELSPAQVKAKAKAAEDYWRYNSETIRPMGSMPNSPLHAFATEAAAVPPAI
jgi:hypothetical protein